MGNSITCFNPSESRGSTETSSPASSTVVRLVLVDGSHRLLLGRHPASEIMLEFPDCNVYDADTFFIGRPVPAVSLSGSLLVGRTYLVLPADRFDGGTILSASSLSDLTSTTGNIWTIGDCPLEYVKDADGRRAIKVRPEFIFSLLQRSAAQPAGGSLCSSPELQKQYALLVGSKGLGWSPKLETINEANYSQKKNAGPKGRCGWPCAIFASVVLDWRNDRERLYE